MADKTEKKQRKAQQNAANRIVLDLAADELELLGYEVEYLTYEQRADIVGAALEAAEADEELEQSDPMDRVWMITALASYEKTLQAALNSEERQKNANQSWTGKNSKKMEKNAMEHGTGQKQQKPQIWDEDCYQRRIAGIHAKRPANAVSNWTYLQTVARDYRAWLDRADGDTTEIAGDRYWEVCDHTVIAWTQAIEAPQFLTVSQRAHICQDILESMAKDYTVPAYTPDDIYALYKTVMDYEKTVLALTNWIATGRALLDCLQTVCTEKEGTAVQATMLRLDGLDWGPSDERILETVRMGMDIEE